ncbi:MAG: T9SS type A sorting domain-containing protein [Ignavibacteria bacterium]
MKKFIALFLLISICKINTYTYCQLQDPYSTKSVNSKKTASSNSFPAVVTNGITFFPTPMGVFTYYDLQSNAVPNQIWHDTFIPSQLHAVFMVSPDTNLINRYTAYLYSNDFGQIWQRLDNVPPSRSGFPSISGFTNGAAVIANHNNTNSTNVRSKIYYDAGPGFSVFTELDPGIAPNSVASLFPRVLGINSDKILMAVMGNIVYSNNGIINWSNADNDGAETYAISQSPSGIIGHTYIGFNPTILYDAFYRSSTDEGLTWSVPLKIWDWNNNSDSLGVFRGISMVFGNNNQPNVAFEVSKLTETGFFPNLPSSIRVWNPTVNNGIPVIVADENNVDFYPNKGNVTDGFLPLTRPAIGRPTNGNALLLVFNATTGIYGNDSSSYYKGMFSYSIDYLNWSQPVRMTPETPLYDWRYFSISQTNYVDGSFIKANIMCQADSIPGAYVNGSDPFPAQAVYFTTYDIVGISQITGEVPDNFKLHQNYPNPFNPITIIKYQCSMYNDVSLKVYDVLGNEVLTLVNEKQTAGSYSVTFDGSNFPSGVYFYKLEAGEFVETKRMILLK